MNPRNSGFSVVHVAIAIILVANCVVGHEKSANVNRMKRLTDNGSMQLQQQQHPKSATDLNSMPKTAQTLKDRHHNNNDNDKIVFDRGDLYGTVNTQRAPSSATVTSMTISSNLTKSNETNHQYSGKANGEYEFR